MNRGSAMAFLRDELALVVITLGLGLMTAIVATSGGFLPGFQDGFRINAGFSVLALLVTSWR